MLGRHGWIQGCTYGLRLCTVPDAAVCPERPPLRMHWLGSLGTVVPKFIGTRLLPRNTKGSAKL